MTQVSIWLFIVNMIWEYIKTSWPVVGPLVGILIGAWIAHRNQRSHWVADCKREEYKELLSASSGAMLTYLKAYASPPITSPNRTMVDEETVMANVTQNRLFIRERIEKLQVLKKWHSAADTVAKDKDAVAFGDSIQKLLKEIRETATSDIGG